MAVAKFAMQMVAGVCWRVRHSGFVGCQVMGLYEKDDNQSLHESVQIYEMVLAQTKDLKALTKLQARGPPTPPSTLKSYL